MLEFSGLRLRRFLAELAASPTRLAFVACGLVALAAVWLPRYPVGVDLPQHANLFRLWADLAHGPFEYRATYHVEYFTPYLLPYAVALPLTKLFGALIATKLLLSFLVIATPITMSRWLRAVGAAPGFGLLGFVIAFDYWYIWGFMSCAVATPLMFAYLASFEAQGAKPSLKAMARTSLFALMLFFSHGITFAVSLAVAGVSWFLRGRWFKRYRATLHVAPLFGLALFWIASSQKQTLSHRIEEWFDWQRAITLFSGAFMPFPDQTWAIVAAVGVGSFLLLARPKLAFSPARWVPVTIALAGFVALPDWIASTWLVGSRFCVFIHAFAPALLVPRRSDPVARRWFGVLAMLVFAFLVVLNFRLQAFNRELAGFRDVAAAIPEGSDVQTLVPETNSTSAVFGRSIMGQIPAWVSAENGGLIANDSAVAGYYQIPIRRNAVPSFQHYPYAIARGGYDQYRYQLRGLTTTAQGSAKLIKESDGWILMKRAGIENQDFEVVRYSQSWGEIHLDRAVGGNPLAVAGVHYDHGIGTHVQSFVRLRFKRAVNTLRGEYGVDDEACERARAAFRIRNSDGDVLLESGELGPGQKAQPFATQVDGSEIVLEAFNSSAIDCGHADWLNLTVE